MPEEPSVLDYIKSKLKFWQRREKIGIPGAEIMDETGKSIAFVEPSTFHPSNLQPATAWPWRSLLALTLALGGQRAFEPSGSSLGLGFALYLVAATMLIWAYWRGEWTLASQPSSEFRADTFKIGRVTFLPRSSWHWWHF